MNEEFLAIVIREEAAQPPHSVHESTNQSTALQKAYWMSFVNNYEKEYRLHK
jgi:hypothetical protein